jgi:hypothetical protein
MCFQCTVLMHETYELWMNEFCMISIPKSWYAKCVILIFMKYQQFSINKFLGKFTNVGHY